MLLQVDGCGHLEEVALHMPMFVLYNALICYVVQVLLEKFGPDTRFVPIEPGTFFW
jgi:hypothetical protein